MKFALSKIVFILIVVFLFISQLFYHKWDNSAVLAGGDPWGYYSYLPAVFIHHDLDNLKGSFTARFHEDYHRGFDTSKAFITAEVSYPKDGRTPVIKYTYGVAVLQFPFFYAAHLLAPSLHFEPNGYSKIYLIAINLSLLFYAVFGLWFIRKLMLLYYSETITTIILISIALATNIYFFIIESAPMAHVYLFFLFSVLLYSVALFFQKNNWKYILATGFCCGLISVIRPNEVACIFIPLFYDITGIDSLKERGKLFLREWKKAAIAMLLFLLPFVILIIYWKTLSGQWFYYSYPGEKFNFLHPQLGKGLFSFSNGWFAYTPVMLLAVLGLPVLFFKRKEWAIPFLLFIPLHIYVIYSWWCWNYINGFGSRPMIETYPLWTIPLGGFLQFTFNKKYFLFIIVPVILLFISLNIFQTWQMHENLLLSEMSNHLFVEHTMFKTEITAKDLAELDSRIEQPSDLKFKRELFRNEFEDSTDAHYVHVAGRNGFSYRSDGSVVYLTGCNKSAMEMELKPGDWVKGSVWCRPLSGTVIYDCSVLIIAIKRREKFTQYNSITLQNKVLKKKIIHPYSIDGEGTAAFFIPLPKNLKPDDRVQMYLVCNSVPILVDDVTLEVWQ